MKPKKYDVDLPVAKIKVSPFHFRKETVEQKLDELAESIKEVGLIHSVSVVEPPEGGFELINGHRRWMAHKRAGLRNIRTNVYTYEPEELEDENKRQQAVVKFLLAANNAEPLVPVERARYYQEMMDKVGWDIDDLARAHHKDPQEIQDDLIFLNLDDRVLELVRTHPDSFTEAHLRVLAEHSTPSVSKSWTMTSDEQVEVAEALALQRDKRIVGSARAFKLHINDVVKKRRETAKAAKRKLGAGGDDPVKSLFKLLDAARKAVEELTKADLSLIKEIEARDKGSVYQDLLTRAQDLIDFAEGPIQRLRPKGTVAKQAAEDKPTPIRKAQ